MRDSTPTSFRLDQPTRDQIANLAREIQCSRPDVVRYALIALRKMVDDGYEFREFSGTAVFRREGRTTEFFRVGEGGSLVEKGSAEWTGA